MFESTPIQRHSDITNLQCLRIEQARTCGSTQVSPNVYVNRRRFQTRKHDITMFQLTSSTDMTCAADVEQVASRSPDDTTWKQTNPVSALTNLYRRQLCCDVSALGRGIMRPSLGLDVAFACEARQSPNALSHAMSDESRDDS